jgi:hypothetical protein
MVDECGEDENDGDSAIAMALMASEAACRNGHCQG